MADTIPIIEIDSYWATASLRDNLKQINIDISTKALESIILQWYTTTDREKKMQTIYWTIK